MGEGGTGARQAVGSRDDGTLLGCGGHGGDATTVLESNLRRTFVGGMLVSGRRSFRYIDEGMSP
jgi:hypothetical protein